MLELKEAIVQKVAKENNIKAREENVIVTCGSQEAMMLATAATLDVSQKALVPDPGFMGYIPMFQMFNTVPVSVPLKEKHQFEVQPDDLKKMIDKKTKVLLLNSPSNPTGNVIRKKALEEIADIAVENDLYIFSDEAYEKLLYDDTQHVSIGSFNGMKKYVLTFQSFSKSFAMCGYRLGYCIGPKDLVKMMTKTHMYSTLSAPTISQLIGTKVLSLPNKYIQRMVRDYAKRRSVLVSRLNGMGLPTPNPKGAFYTFSNIQQYSKNSFDFASSLLKKGKVAVVPGREFGKYGEGYIRCSFATKLALIQKALDRMEKFLK
jgi:aminotransferase